MLAFTDEVHNCLLTADALSIETPSTTLAFGFALPCLTSHTVNPTGPTLSDDHKTVLGIPLQSYLDQMLVGIMLSDGTLVKKYVNGGTYLQLAQSIIHLPYLTYVHALYVAGG